MAPEAAWGSHSDRRSLVASGPCDSGWGLARAASHPRLSGLQSVYERQGIAVMTPTVPGSPKAPFLGIPRGTMRRQKSIGKKCGTPPQKLPLGFQTALEPLGSSDPGPATVALASHPSKALPARLPEGRNLALPTREPLEHLSGMKLMPPEGHKIRGGFCNIEGQLSVIIPAE